jgi:hypothetical protein
MSPRLMPTRSVIVDRLDDAGELHQQAVAHDLDDAAAMLGDLGVDERLAMGLEIGQRSRLVDPHEPRVADHVGGQNGGQSAFQARSPSPERLAVMGRRIHAGGRSRAIGSRAFHFAEVAVAVRP